MRFILISGHVTVLLMAAVAYGLNLAIPPMGNMDAVIDRLVLALKWDLLPLLALVFGIFAVASKRAFTKANNPLIGVETARHRVHIRYLQNTLEQVVVYVLTTLIASIYLESGLAIRWIPISAISFFFFRMLFWAGYLKGWRYRAPGMVGTGFSYLPLLTYTLYCGICELKG